MRCDLHNHSWYSFDSLLNPKLLFKYFEKTGQVYTVTDHDTVKHIKTFKSFKGKSTFIPGYEWATDSGDILAFFIDELPPNRELVTSLEFIKENGGVTVLPHPFRHSNMLPNKITENLELFDMVEIMNGRTPFHKNIQSFQLAAKSGIPYTVGSDAHTRFDIGNASYVLEGDPTDLDDIRQSLLENKIISLKYGKIPWFSELLSTLIKITKTGNYSKYPTWVHQLLIVMKNELLHGS